MATCQKCGKKVTLRELSKNYNRCQDCFQKECSEYEFWKARQLSSPDLITRSQELVQTCSSFLSEFDCEKMGHSGEINREKQNVQAILDFSSLRDVMKKMGVSIIKFECPDCKGTVEIPEAGNIIICQQCQTPIRPNEIYKKMSQIQ